ncbi:MAG: DUF2147 domain-containing protein [Treponema sp.]|nr:DUF2147 domain-containing protein [Treponema sp.]
MKKTFLLLIVFLVTAGFSFAADPVEGFWLSIDEKSNKVTAGWHIYQEGGKLYGKVLSSTLDKPGVIASKCKDSYPGFPVAGKISTMPVVGTPWIFGLSADKPGEWSGGNVVNPEDGKIYKCKIIFRAADGKKFSADTLEMRGEIGLGIGRSQFWQKTDFETANTLWPK